MSSAQEEEVEVLSSIYGDEFYPVEAQKSIYAVRISNASGDRVIVLQFQYLAGYPDSGSLLYDIQAPWLRGSAFEHLRASLDQQITGDSPVVHLLVESVRDFLEQYEPSVYDKSNPPPLSTSRTCLSGGTGADGYITDQCLEIFHGEPLVDRKSVFQAHCARISTVEQTKLFVNMLLEDRKIAAATHNIVAWRIITKSHSGSDITLADCDDDGETHAGSRLLNLLSIANVKNVIVMVSRWYGGIQLGPDRFKHINNVARNLLVAHNLLGENKSSTGEGTRKTTKAKKK